MSLLIMTRTEGGRVAVAMTTDVISNIHVIQTSEVGIAHGSAGREHGPHTCLGCLVDYSNQIAAVTMPMDYRGLLAGDV